MALWIELHWMFLQFLCIKSQGWGLQDHPFRIQNPSVTLGLKTSLRLIQINVPHQTNRDLEESNHLGKRFLRITIAVDEWEAYTHTYAIIPSKLDLDVMSRLRSLLFTNFKNIYVCANFYFYFQIFWLDRACFLHGPTRSLSPSPLSMIAVTYVSDLSYGPGCGSATRTRFGPPPFPPFSWLPLIWCLSLHWNLRLWMRFCRCWFFPTQVVVPGFELEVASCQPRRWDTVVPVHGVGL